MSGGSATHAGIGFQDKVAGWLAVHILSDEPIQFLGLPMGAKPVSIEMETSAPVDDILISTSDGGFCFVNVKRSITLTRDPTSLPSWINSFANGLLVNRPKELPAELGSALLNRTEIG